MIVRIWPTQVDPQRAAKYGTEGLVRIPARPRRITPSSASDRVESRSR
jgi:hypothetical protein